VLGRRNAVEYKLGRSAKGYTVSTTFEELDIPFPLFEASTEDACDFDGRKRCSLCNKQDQYCFRLGIGCAIMLECSKCHTLNGLDADDRQSISCRYCQATIAFPEIADEEVTVCYDCLRLGKAAITKDTELGMVSWDQAFKGITHGIPGLNRPEFEMVPLEDDWVGVRLPQEMMFKLLRTPTYSTIQGDQWLFCCQAPMIYVGEWSREEFSKRASDGDGQKLFNQIVADVIPGLWEDELHDVTSVYVFRCPACHILKAHWDLA